MVDLDKLEQAYGPYKVFPIHFVEFERANILLEAMPDLIAELRAARAVVEAARVITSHRLFKDSGYEESPTPGNIWPVIKAMREGVEAYDANVK